MRWLLALWLAACGTATGPQPTPVVLWHAYSGAEKEALEAVAADFARAEPDIALRLVAVPYDAFPDKIGTAIPNGNGPDLFVFAHDRIGDWAAARILEPIELFVDDELADRFDQAPLLALVRDDALWGLPLAVKSLALFYRTDLVPTPPVTTDELLAVGRGLTDASRGRYGLAYEGTKLYGHAAWLHGFGGAIFDEAGRLAIDSPEAAASVRFARGLGQIVPPETTSALVATLFQEGRVGMILSGPWLVGNLAAGVPWKVAPLPVVSATGRPAAPFLGVEGLMMSARARDKRAAFRVMAFLSSDAAAVVRAVRARQVVPNLSLIHI